MRPHVWEKKVIFDARIFSLFPPDCSPFPLSSVHRTSNDLGASVYRIKDTEENERGEERKSFFTDRYLGRGGSLAQLYLIVCSRVLLHMYTIFICGAADRSGRGKRSSSSSSCCRGDTIFQFSMYSSLGSEKAKTLFQKGREKAKTVYITLH